MSRDLHAELDHCDREIAEHEALLRAGHQDIDGLLQAIQDWAAEKRLVQELIEGGE